MRTYSFARGAATTLVLLVASSACGPATSPVGGPASISTVATSEEIAGESEKASRSEHLVDEHWSATFLQQTKVGYGRTAKFEIVKEDGALIRTTSEQTIRFARSGQTTEQTIQYSVLATAEGEVRSLESTLSGNGTTVHSTGRVSDGLLTLETITQGKRATESIPWDDGTLSYFGLEESLRTEPLKPGESRTIACLQPLINQVAHEELTALAEEDVDLLGERKRLIKIRSVARFAGQKIESTYWADGEGRIWRFSNPVLQQETYRTSEAIARADATGNFDLMAATFVEISPPAENLHDSAQVVYRVHLKHGDPAKEFPSGGTQTVKPIDDHTAEVTVRKVTVATPATRGQTSPVDADFAPNSLIQSDDRVVAELARSVAVNSEDKTAVAIALERLVHQRVAKKNFSEAFATAADVARSFEGDCTEHAALLAALCRSRGIAARVVGGLVYVPRDTAFGYHMWNEVWLGDRWVPLDATLGRGAIGGGHLKLFDSNLEGASALVAFLPVMNVLGQLELEVLSIAPPPADERDLE